MQNQQNAQAGAAAGAVPQPGAAAAAGGAAAAGAAAAPPLPPLPQWLIDANNLGLDVEERVLHELLCNFHNFTVGQYQTLREQGYGTLYELRSWKHKDIESLLNTLGNRTNNRGGRQYGHKLIRQLQAIAWLVRDSASRNVAVDLTKYMQDPDLYIESAVLAAEHAANDSSSADKPDKFKYEEWITWEESVQVYLESERSNARGAPLCYVIRKDLPANTNWANLDTVQQRIHTPALQGFVFNLDTKVVLTLLKELCLGTDAEVWIQNIRCGRAAMIALRTHYDGPDEAKKRTLEAESKMKGLFYKHEYSFPFERFITEMQKHFKTLERYEMPVHEQKKVETLFEKCQNNHPEFKMEVGICRSQHDTFIGAITYLKTAVARVFPEGKRSTGRTRQVSATTRVNGIDLSDFSKNYSRDEVNKLKSTPEGKKAWYNFLNDPRRQSHNKAYRKRKGQESRKIKALKKKLKAAENSSANGNDTNSTGSASNMSGSDQRLVAATINGVMNASRHNGQQVQFPLNGRSASIRSAQRGQGTGTSSTSGQSVSSEVTFDHLGNPM